MSLLEIESLHSGYDEGEVVHGVSVAAAEGGITAVIGPNGAGKTTLAQTIAGVVPARRGTIRFDGQPIERCSARERTLLGLGYTPQRRNVFGELTVQENLDVVVRAFKVPRERVEEVLEQFPILRQRQRQRAGTLSGGERQQLAIASSLLMRPRLLMLDEPTTGLAPRIVETLVEQIRAIRGDGAGVLWVIEEHPSQILPHCDWVYLVESGQVRHEASGPDLLADPRFTEMFLGAQVPDGASA